MIVKVISIYLFVGVMLLSFLFVNSFSRGKSSYSKVLGVLSLALQVYLLGYLMELNVNSLPQMLFWNQIQYLGIPFFPALWLAVSMLYTGRGKYLQGAGWMAVFAVPLITFVLRMTNDWHHLFYSHIQLQQSETMTLMLLTKGPLYFLQTIFVLIALILSTLFYFQRYRKSSDIEKMPFKLLLAASVLPYVTLILVAVNWGDLAIDYTALILPLCVLLINFALTHYNFMEIKELARERVFEDSEEGLILLNRKYIVVDFNAASARFFDWFGIQIKGGPLSLLLREQRELLKSILRSESKIFSLKSGSEERYVYVSTRKVFNKGQQIGNLATLEDVTEKELLKLRLTQLANTDETSGLNNRRSFRERAEDAYRRARRYHEPLAVLMLDIDYFKRVNDTFGHSAGDQVIRDFSQILASSFRETDIVGRMGGEEFAVVMLNAGASEAYEKAEAFRKALQEKDIMFAEQQIKVTVSIGVSELGDDISNVDALLRRADKASYKAKHAGRNCTVVDS